ncbi:MAG: hypothetical protein EPN82_04575 [Bacteroidetes bacterium]|nr:MAG: hypothetical protein EPN82_04575 [Bacteroidota bacterium]
MKPVIKFEYGEIRIRKAEADLIRERILSIAKEKDIGIVPIQYERLLKDIEQKLSDMSELYDFILDGKPVDFSKENFAMFKSKVLKTFFHSKREDEIITLQKKNLDILCFYAFDICWNDFKNMQNQNYNDGNGINEHTEKRINAVIKIINRNTISYLLISLLFIISIALSVNYFELKGKYVEREIKYNSALKALTEQFQHFTKFDYHYYDSLPLPNDDILLKIDFDDMNQDYKNFPYHYEVIVNKSGSSIKSEPGIKTCLQLGKEKAFGFGLRNCISGCYVFTSAIPYYKQPNSTILRIKLGKKYHLTYLTFKWVEVGHNWGSIGYVYINGNRVGDLIYNSIGNYPPSSMMQDERLTEYRAKLDETASSLDFHVFDISNESEIFINNIVIYGK